MTDSQPTVIFSGIQPSGVLHIGNYLGAIKQWLDIAKEADKTYFCIVDEHAITVPYEPKDLPEKVMNAAAMYLACGLDPENSTIFVQSHVPEHTEAAWLLMTHTPFGELSRMTQFKEKSKKQADDTTVGLFTYPVLMAADILLYNTTTVPVGEDQVQHIELTRDIAKRFNNRFGETFAIPKAQINKNTARIMSVSDPKCKMSKSDPEKSYIALTDEPDVIRKKIMSAVTETQAVFSFNKSGPAVKNLLAIYEAFSEEPREEIEAKFKGSGYKEFKESLATLIVEKLTPIQQHYRDLRENDDELRIMLGRGAHVARQTASQKLTEMKQKMGLL